MDKRQAFINLAKAGGSRQDFIDLAASFGLHDPGKALMIHDMMMSGALQSELKHGGIASLAHGGRIGFAEGEDWKSKIGSFFSGLGWGSTGEDLRRGKEYFKARNLTEGDKHLRYFKAMDLPHSDDFFKDLMESWAIANKSRDPEDKWKKYKQWLEMENLERANIAKGGLAGILNLS